MTPRYATRLLFALLLFPLGCAAIIGIEDAERISDGNVAAGGSAAGGSSAGGTGGSDGGTGGGASSSGGEGGGKDPTLCETYCETVLETCNGELAVYTSQAICLALCETMPIGDPADSSADTLHCRLNQAIAAEETGEPGDHCPVAGLGGGSICGDNCEALCRAMASTCPDEWDDNAECLADCQGVEDLGGHNVQQDAGATVQCRLWHVGAATQAQVPHCAHAAGAAPCAAD